jgi:hypothetical protein
VLFVSDYHAVALSARCSRMMFSWSRADSRVIRAGRTHYFVCRQHAMSRVFARQSHAVMLFRSSTPPSTLVSPPPVCIRVARHRPRIAH